MSEVKRLIQLWDSSRDGNEQSFAVLHKVLYPSLFKYAVRIVKDEDHADDLLQDLFLKFWQNKGKIGTLSNVSAYFHRSARFMIFSTLRNTKVQELKLEKICEPDIEFSKEEVIISEEFDSERRTIMLTAINKLPKKQREIIFMRFYQDLDYAEIAQIVGINYQSVVNHIYRSMQILRAVCNVSELYLA